MRDGMVDREKVIKGLECCIIPGGGGCDDCPYLCKGICQELLGENAIALLKAQEPRVMTLEEFQASENNPKWLETKDGWHNRWTLGNAGYEKFYDNCMCGYLPIEEYGKKWRCWTSRPTDEVRRATPWK